jgi:hypothetical protein
VRKIVSVFALLFASAPAWSQVKIFTVTDQTDPTSNAVMADLRSKLSSYPKLFTLTSGQDANLIVHADCLPRIPTELFVCYYTTHYVGGSSKTFMGGGIYSAATSSIAADNILVAIGQDVAERWKDTIRSNAIESLESCLFLTQSSCKVPAPLTAELKTNVINLSQYLQKGGLKR